MVQNKFEIWEILNFIPKEFTERTSQFMKFRKYLNLNNFYSISRSKDMFTNAELCFFSLLLQNCCKNTLKMIHKSAKLQTDMEKVDAWLKLDQNELVSKMNELFMARRV